MLKEDGLLALLHHRLCYFCRLFALATATTARCGFLGPSLLRHCLVCPCFPRLTYRCGIVKVLAILAYLARCRGLSSAENIHAHISLARASSSERVVCNINLLASDSVYIFAVKDISEC